MHIVLKRGSIDKPLNFNNGLFTQCSPQGFSAERAALPFTFRAFNNYAHDVGGHVT